MIGDGNAEFNCTFTLIFYMQSMENITLASRETWRRNIKIISVFFIILSVHMGQKSVWGTRAFFRRTGHLTPKVNK